MRDRRYSIEYGGLGQFDAGALKEETFKKLVAKGVAIRALATFPNVTKPWIVREGLQTHIRDPIRASLLAMEDEIVLKAKKRDGFLQGNDSDYLPIREAMEENVAFFQ